MSDKSQDTNSSRTKRRRITTSRGAPVVSKKSEERLMDHARWDEIAVYRNYLYGTKLVIGIVLGFITALLYYDGYQTPSNFAPVAGLLWFFILLIGLLLSYLLMRYGFKITEEDMSTKDIFLKATFTYIVTFIVTTAMVWMLLMGTEELGPLIEKVLG